MIFLHLRHLQYFAKLLQGQTWTEMYCIYCTVVTYHVVLLYSEWKFFMPLFYRIIDTQQHWTVFVFGIQVNNLIICFKGKISFLWLLSPLLKCCNEITYIFGLILHVYIVCKWVFLSRVQAKRVISKNDSATQHHTRYLSQLSETLSPHFLPVWVPGIWPDRRSITMSEHLKVRTEISSRSHGYSFALREMQPEPGQDLETGEESTWWHHRVPSASSTRGLGFFEGVKWHTCWLSRITGTCQWLSTENKPWTSSKARVSKVKHSHRHLWCIQNKLCEINKSWNGPMSKRITHPSENSKMFFS